MLGKLLPVIAMAVGFVFPVYVWAKFVTIRAVRLLLFLPTTKPDRLNQQTVYSLQCTALDSSTYAESTTINLVPAYQER